MASRTPTDREAALVGAIVAPVLASAGWHAAKAMSAAGGPPLSSPPSPRVPVDAQPPAK